MTIIRALTRKSATALAAATIAVVFMQPNVLVAQERGLALEEIVVTAQRRAQSLQEVPLAVEVFAGSEIRKQGFRDLDDLANFSPTILIEPRVQDQDVAIRGFGTTGNTLRSPQRTAAGLFRSERDRWRIQHPQQATGRHLGRLCQRGSCQQ
jgi:iron complex outermembrane receptor protein